MTSRRILILFIILLITTACTPSPRAVTDTPAPASTSTATAIPSASLTPIPTFTTVLTTKPSPTSSQLPPPTSTSTATPLPTQTATPEQRVRFAVIGDYGYAGPGLEAITSLIDSWQVDLIITTGDNNYPLGSAGTIDQNIGQYFHQYINPYTGIYGEESETNRFFPSLGNHDWYTEGAQPYLDYFTLPGNERYYTFTWGSVDFFALDSDEHEPDGVGSSSIQAAWLQNALSASTNAWRIVYMHYPPYSSGSHGSITWMRWPFSAWGATAVLAGHDHTYERLLVGDLPYFIVGSSGYSLYNFVDILEGSLVRYNAAYGAMLVEAGEGQMEFQFFNQFDELVDSFQIYK